MPSQLGVLKKQDIRTQWPNEAADFTPWLAMEQNLSALGEALGDLELEFVQKEANVGPYSADILAKTIDGFVVIENQLEKTNHDHLGKAITYASVLNAKTIIWIASQFTEEHQRAIEWLNDISESISFYAVLLELWQIGDSLPAVKFNVIARPTVIRPGSLQGQSTGELSTTRKTQLEFWTQFSKKLVEKNILQTTQTPKPQASFDITIGKSNVFISNIVNTWENKISIRLYISAKNAQSVLLYLQESKDAIENDLGETLIWDASPEAQHKIISLSRNFNLFDQNAWDEALNWLAAKAKDFKRVFTPRVKSINLNALSVNNENNQ